MDLTKTGRLIAEKRKDLGLTQDELGRQLNVTAKAVSKWERGISLPDTSLLSRLATALRISIVDLLSGEVIEQVDSSFLRQSQIEKENDAAHFAAEPITITLGMDGRTVVSPYLYGENLEHTRANVFQGISAQMLRNRKFAGKPAPAIGLSMEWYTIGDRTYFAQCEAYTQHSQQFYHMKRKLERNSQRIVNIFGGEAGMGQHGLSFAAGKEYEFRIVAKTAGELTVKAALTSRGGEKTYAESTVKISGNEWTSYELRLTAGGSDSDGDLRLTFIEKGALDIGAVSLMPAGHFRGMRRDVVELFREMGVKILRWPGGNFAGDYCWVDGLMPVDMRAPLESHGGIETQPCSMGYDYHEINTDDFIALCREIGAEPFITINPTWNTPEENAAWVEYCNGGADTKFGAVRAARGYEAPFGVQFWSLGNEFGYGHMEGDNTPYGYSNIAKANAEKMLEASSSLSLCSSGPYPNADWAEYAAKPLRSVARLVSLHYYAPAPTYADPEQLKDEYYACLSSVETARGRIVRLRSQLDDSLKISFDEWNTWHAWNRPSSIVDGLFTALMMHMFIQEEKRNGLALVCHFEAVNEGMMDVCADGAKLTASGQAFAMMKHHAGGTLRYAGPNAAATVKDGLLTVTAVNPSFDETRDLSIQDSGKLVNACMYTCDCVTPYTWFDLHTVSPVWNGSAWSIEMPPHSMLLVQLQIE